MDWILLAQGMAVAEQADESSQLASLIDSVMSPAGYIVLSAALFGFGVFMLLPPRGRGTAFVVGAVTAGLGVFLFLIPTIAQLPSASAFLLLEALAVLGGLGTVTSRNPVYSAIWFASALLSIGALLLLAGAQFLGLATVAVYAGAIVVTFLFVLMLAQPEGHAVYDRIGWGWFPSMCAATAAASVVAIICAGLLASPAEATMQRALRANVVLAIQQFAAGDANSAGTQEDTTATSTAESDKEVASSIVREVVLTKNSVGAAELIVTLPHESRLLANGEAVVAAAIRATTKDLDPSTRISFRQQAVLADDHVARLGGELFGRHLISIQVVAVLLLVALVAAIAMAIHGKNLDPPSSAQEVAAG